MEFVQSLQFILFIHSTFSFLKCNFVWLSEDMIIVSGAPHARQFLFRYQSPRKKSCLIIGISGAFVLLQGVFLMYPPCFLNNSRTSPWIFMPLEIVKLDVYGKQTGKFWDNPSNSVHTVHIETLVTVFLRRDLHRCQCTQPGAAESFETHGLKCPQWS